MVLQWDPRQEIFTVADGWEPVRLVPIRTAPGDPAVGAEGYPAQGIRQAVSSREAAQSGGQYTATDIIWQVVAPTLPEAPEPGDLLLDGQGVRYRVLEARLLERAGRYRCVCRQLAIEAGLDTLVDIERAETAKGPDGVELLQWQVWRSGIRAKLHLAETRVERDGDQMIDRPVLKIYFAEPVPLDQHSRIRGPDGVHYRIVAVRGQERIDGLMEAEVERIEL